MAAEKRTDDSEDPVINTGTICVQGDGTLCVNGTSTITIPPLRAIWGQAVATGAAIPNGNPWGDGEEPTRGEVLADNEWRICGISKPASGNIDIRVWGLYGDQASFAKDVENDIDPASLTACSGTGGSGGSGEGRLIEPTLTLAKLA